MATTGPLASQREMATVAIAEVGTLFGIQALQVDFDATVSQRAFYRDVLQQLRRRLPASMPLFTALASWCIFDDWLAGLPVDEVVPMVFAWGLTNIASDGFAADDFRAAACRHSLGIATDEPCQPYGQAASLHVSSARMATGGHDQFPEEVRRWPQPWPMLAIGMVAGLLGSRPVCSCGPYFEQAIFTYTVHPDVPLTSYAQGQWAFCSRRAVLPLRGLSLPHRHEF